MSHIPAAHHAVRPDFFALIPGSGNDKLIYQITDHLGSVRVIKDGEGTVLQRFDYYPFGSESRVWTAGTSTPQSALRYRFGGKEIAGQKVSVSTGIAAAAAGSPYLDFGARVYDPRTAAWLSQDPLSEKYYSISPYAYCTGDPVNLVDINGTSWRPYYIINADNVSQLAGFEWVSESDSYDDKGFLKEGLFHQAVFFSDNGSFDSNNNYNIGSSTATVYLADGTTQSFSACTNPSGTDKATVPEGLYEAYVGTHTTKNGSYTALKMRDVGADSNTIELGTENPAYTDGRTYATGIDIHKAGINNFTGIDRNGNYVSEGCLLIDTNNWSSFIGLFNNTNQRNNKVSVILSRTFSSPFPANQLSPATITINRR